MNVHVLQHVPFEGLGSIERWLEARHARVGYTRFWTDAQVPSLEDIDLLIAMGGPMSVNDEQECPWLIGEMEVIREAITRGVAVLGVCLGAQLISSALGARVYRNPVKEIGWHPVRGIDAGAETLALPPDCTVFHWHGETFELPRGAVLLASSAACVNQAFQYQRNVVGLQFHLETTPGSARALVEHCREDMVPGPFVQSEPDMLQVPDSRFETINALMEHVLNWLVQDTTGSDDRAPGEDMGRFAAL